ncbi:CsbD family protein [Microbacterium sp. KUDC0406]|uniref:CsbD family protein n=1 Tax=Microbacterium sp. KUDC0406 TaxID=2909588 RepID=UPI001F1716D6|nr:CsbD family protein [Microbacterium sp. KUDC0406]UJP10180.1 CsbD family protein [Microbacterium sp. KUDC0406]
MSAADKMKHTAEDMAGKVKEGAGKLTGNDSLEAEGKMDQAKAAAKKAGDDVKDAAENAADHVKDAARDATDRD